MRKKKKTATLDQRKKKKNRFDERKMLVYFTTHNIRTDSDRETCVRGPIVIRAIHTHTRTYAISIFTSLFLFCSFSIVYARCWPFHNVKFEYDNNLRDMKQF